MGGRKNGRTQMEDGWKKCMKDGRKGRMDRWIQRMNGWWNDEWMDGWMVDRWMDGGRVSGWKEGWIDSRRMD